MNEETTISILKSALILYPPAMSAILVEFLFLKNVAGLDHKSVNYFVSRSAFACAFVFVVFRVICVDGRLVDISFTQWCAYVGFSGVFSHLWRREVLMRSPKDIRDYYSEAQIFLASAMMLVYIIGFDWLVSLVFGV